jgi:hypothetical protein
MPMPESVEPYLIATDSIDVESLLAGWSSELPNSCRLLAVSLFGDLFVAKESGEVFIFEVTSGQLRQIATCVEEFEWDVDQPGKQQELLMSDLAIAARAAGIIPERGECLAFQTPPILGGKLHPSNLIRWDLVKYHAGLSKLFPQLRGMAPGDQVVMKRPGLQ